MEKSFIFALSQLTVAKFLRSQLFLTVVCWGKKELLATSTNQLLRPKLLKDTWKNYPAALACFKWMLLQVKVPYLSEHLSIVLPTALITVDDFNTESQVFGISCLEHIIEHVTRTELNWYGQGDVIYKALERLLYHREAELVRPLLRCVVLLLGKLEGGYTNHDNNYKWSRCDDVLQIVLQNTEHEQNIPLRRAYIDSLPALLDASKMGVIRWSKRLLRILREYLEVLKVYLQHSQPRIAHNSEALFHMLLRLLYDITKSSEGGGMRSQKIDSIVLQETVDLIEECPPSLPIYGSYWFVLLCNYKYIYKSFDTLARWYNTKLLGLHLGPLPTVVACDLNTVKEIFARPEFNGKLDCYISQARAMGITLGLFFTDSDLWIEQRRFTLRHLRDYGFARRSVLQEENVRQEVMDLLALLNSSKGKEDYDVFHDDCALLPQLFCPGTINCLWSVLAGDRFPPEAHKKLRQVADASFHFVKDVEPTGGALVLTPWLRHFGRKGFGFDGLVNGSGYVTEFFREAVKDHEKNYSEDSLRDFIDDYIQELKKNDTKNIVNSFSEDQLLLLATDLILPTAATMPAMLTFTLIMLLHHPQVMLKAQKEIDSVVSRDRLPSLDDRSRSCDENGGGQNVLKNKEKGRRAIGRPRTRWMDQAQKDMEAKGAGLRERFEEIDRNGRPAEVETSNDDDDDDCRRVCVGETFSRFTIYLFLAALLQNFTFSAPEGKPIPGLDDIISGFSLSPPDFWVKVVPRN
uniref:Cytochrome P450 n=1 Tax=Timema cristinae TaxID=61476 RepID=A0A7R9CQ49_TIMCR|nr:unnamed protein product [Timema cristinae]